MSTLKEATGTGITYVKFHDREDSYAEYLDQEGEVEIAGRTFFASDIIKTMDEVGFNVGVNEYFTNGWVERKYVGEAVYIQNDDQEAWDAAHDVDGYDKEPDNEAEFPSFSPS